LRRRSRTELLVGARFVLGMVPAAWPWQCMTGVDLMEPCLLWTTCCVEVMFRSPSDDGSSKNS
jgi:hypothetical protein